MNSLKFVATTLIENLVKAARVNMITGEYHFIKEFEGEREGGCLDLKSMDDYPKKIVENGWIYPDDVQDYLSHMRLEYLRSKITKERHRIVHSFRRAVGGTFAWITVEIVAPADYSEQNPWVLYNWREADNDSREMEDAIGMLSIIFHKILKINLTRDTYEPIKVYRSEMTEEQGYSTSISHWMRQFAERGNVYPGDAEDYFAFTDIENLRQYFKKEKEQIRCRYRRKSGGEYRWVEMILLPSVEYADDNQEIMLYIRDIHDAYTEELRYHKELEYYCNYDVLTGLHNRYYYNQYCKHCMDGTQKMPAAVLFGDINGLKYINDNLGHVAGDDYICKFAKMLQERFSKRLCCRISGDEFVVFFENITEDEMAQKFALFHEQINQEEPPIASVGYAWRDGISDVEELVMAAEAAMYKDKRACHERFPEYCGRESKSEGILS